MKPNKRVALHCAAGASTTQHRRHQQAQVLHTQRADRNCGCLQLRGLKPVQGKLCCDASMHSEGALGSSPPYKLGSAHYQQAWHDIAPK